METAYRNILERLLPYLVGLGLISLAVYGSVTRGRPREGSSLDLFWSLTPH